MMIGLLVNGESMVAAGHTVLRPKRVKRQRNNTLLLLHNLGYMVVFLSPLKGGGGRYQAWT